MCAAAQGGPPLGTCTLTARSNLTPPGGLTWCQSGICSRVLDVWRRCSRHLALRRTIMSILSAVSSIVGIGNPDHTWATLSGMRVVRFFLGFSALALASSAQHARAPSQGPEKVPSSDARFGCMHAMAIGLVRRSCRDETCMLVIVGKGGKRSSSQGQLTRAHGRASLPPWREVEVRIADAQAY